MKAGLNGGFKSMGDRILYANGVLGMVNYAAARSGSKCVVDCRSIGVIKYFYVELYL